ncbi:MAG: flagellar filament capping protein FliD [Bryobacteraceae bacterium]|jgi:flagellar hook-associated protein 2
MGTTSSALFTGSSQFSTDLQNVITRAITIASLPITQLNSEVTSLQNQSTALSGLDTKFAALQASIQQIADAAGSGSLNATVSDTSVVSATLGSGAVEGQYSIEVQDAGSYASSLTASAWTGTADDASQHSYQLVVGGNTYNLAPADSSAASVAAAINSAAGGQVRAAVVNVGSSDAPDYRIALQATALGQRKLDILDGGTSLQTPQTEDTQGSLASYVVDNSGVTATSDSRTIQIADGLTVNLLSGDPGNPVTIDVTRSGAALSNALSGFAAAYNAAASALDAQRGQSSGALSGESVVYDLSQTLSSLATYSGADSQFGGLAALGLNLDETGQMTFDATAFSAMSAANPAGVQAFLGTADGRGFLQAATDAMTGVEDPTNGTLKTAEAAVTSQTDSVNQQISDKQDQVNQLQQNLTDQMAAADAAISSMEQQYNYLSGLFDAMQTAEKEYQ